MEIHAESFWLQKDGNSAFEYEDAFYPEDVVLTRQDRFRFAIADGATDSSFSGIWARLLVRAFVEGGGDDIEAILADSQPRWIEQVGKRQLPWYAEQKAEMGAFSSLLGFTICDEPEVAGGYRWRAIAIGDSCLVQVREEQVSVRFPMEHSSLFDSSPFLLPSNPRYNRAVAEHVAACCGDSLAGDTFYLMTDALACWFMAEDEQGRVPWQILRDLSTLDEREPFHEMIARLRAQGDLRNDDCTLTRIDVF